MTTEPQTFNVMCPYCRASYSVPIELLGKKGRCSNCKSSIVLKKQDPDDSLLRIDVAPPALADSETAEQNFAPDSADSDSQLLNLTTHSSLPGASSSFYPFSTGAASAKMEETTSALKASSGLSFGGEFNENIVNDYEGKFPDPPKGVWQAGEILLNGLCQVLPLAPDKLFAEGGVGVVQRVRRRDWNVDLIVKSPKPGVVVTESGKESFERECQTWIELGLHANIVSCYFVRRIDGIPRLFAEYAPDGTLRDWIADKRIYTGSPKESLARLIDISIQFAWGLEHAHSQGLLHLDVKPGNVMTSGSTIKVTDFGLSKFATEMNEKGDPASNFCEGMTPSYCSPEQYEAFQIYRKRREEGAASTDKITTLPMTKQSDIWSWAISILTMFHGRSPCKMGGQTAAEVFEVFLKSQGSSPRPTMPHDMVELMRWCFKKNPSDRPESMQFVADRLVDIYEDAIGSKYPRRQPQNAALSGESLSNKAISLLDLGKSSEALKLLAEASEVEPDHPLITFNNSLALWRSGHILDTQAVERFAELEQNRSFDPASFYVSGLTQIERGNIKSAISSFERVLELDAKRVDVQGLLSQLERLKPLDSQCLTQYVLKKPSENAAPSLFIAENGEFLLVELTDRQFAVLDALTGQTAVKFQPLNIDVEQTSRTVVSEDYRWNLTIKNSDFIVIESATVAHGQTQRIKIRFRKVDWDARVERIAKISTRDASRRSTESLMRFIPEKGGVAVLLNDRVKRRIIDPNQTITAFAITPDGKWIATGNDVSEIRIWNVEQQRCVRTFVGLGGAVEAIWFDPHKRHVVALSKGLCLQFFNVQLLCVFPEKIHAPHQLCQINSSEELLKRQTQLEEALNRAKSCDTEGDVAGVVDAFHNIQNIEGWETTRPIFERLLERKAARATITGVAPSAQLDAHEGVVSALAVSWNGSFLASAGKDAAIRVWSHRSGKTNANQLTQALSLDSHYDWIRTITLSPNNRFLASAGWDQKVYLWDLASGKKLRSIPNSVKSPTRLSFAPDGRTLALGTASGVVMLYDFATGKTLLRLDVGVGEVHSLAFSRDGRFFITSTDDGVRFWNGRNQLPFKEIKTLPAPVLSFDFSIERNLLAAGCANGKIILINLTNGAQTYLSGHLGEVGEVKLFPDSKWLVSTGKDKTLRIWDVVNQSEAHKISSLYGEIVAIALDFPGLTLFTGSEKGVVRKWNIQWDYKVPVPENHCIESERLIAALAARYVLAQRYAESSTPENYYGATAPPLTTRYDQTPLSDGIVQKVYAEAQYRGLVGIPYEKVRNILESLWKDCSEFPVI